MPRTCKQRLQLQRAIALYLATVLCLSTTFRPIAVLIGSLGSQHPHLLPFTALFAIVVTERKPAWKSRRFYMKKTALSAVKDDLSKFLRQAKKEEVVIARYGRPTGIIIGFSSEEDWFDYRLEHDPRFLERIESARRNIKSGRGIRIEDVESI
jgi:hypothetical protein